LPGPWNRGLLETLRAVDSRAAPPFRDGWRVGHSSLIQTGDCRLPRFYFQLIEDGLEGPVDEEGVEYPDLDAAVSDTEAVVAQMMGSNGLATTKTIEVVIGDQQRRPLARVKLALSRDRMS
jgi:hypothetical protein